MKGPQGQKRPGDVVGCAVAVAKLATGEAREVKKQAVTLGRLGGQARADKLSPADRSRIAKTASEARWKGHVKKGETLNT